MEAVCLSPSRQNDQNIRVMMVRNQQLKAQIRQRAEDPAHGGGSRRAVGVLRRGGNRPYHAIRAVRVCGGHGAGDQLRPGGAEQGLDTCIVCAEAAVKDLPGIPDGARVFFMAAGYGDDPAPRKDIKTLEEITGYEDF